MNYLPIEDAWRRRKLLSVVRTSRIKNNMHPKTSSATIEGKRSRGRQYRAVRDSIVDNVNLTMTNVGKDGRIDRWMMHSKDMCN